MCTCALRSYVFVRPMEISQSASMHAIIDWLVNIANSVCGSRDIKNIDKLIPVSLIYDLEGYAHAP